MQTNKVKYLIGKTYLYHSVDRTGLAEEISKRSLNAGVESDILLQVNIGSELSKGGFAPEEIERACEQIKKLPALRIRGLMAMLPLTDDEALLGALAGRMRAEYDKIKTYDENFTYLSMGMSGDWRICLQEGANMLRLGTCIFGHRNYN